VANALERARLSSRFSVKSGFSFTPKTKPPLAIPFTRPASPQPIFDQRLAGLDYGELRSWLEEARESAESGGGRSRVILSCENSHVEVENTGGFAGSYDKTDISIYAECMHGEGFGFAYFSSNTSPPKSAPGETGLKAANMAKAMWDAGKPDNGTYAVVLEIEALDSVLDILLPSFSGDWKRRNVTRLKAGARMFSGKFTLCDDGLAGGTEARPFDDEGTPSARRTLVDRGRVASFLFDRETSALAKENPERISGACSRSAYDHQPSIGHSNIVIPGGDRKDLSDIGSHLEIHSMHGSHTANATTGDFGLEVTVAFLVGKDGSRKPVRGFMLNGNVFDMFAGIEAMEKETRALGGLTAPRIAFRGLKVVV